MMKYKFGILVDSYNLKLWQYNSLKSLLDEGHELVLIVKNQKEKKHKIKFNNILFFVFKVFFSRASLLKEINIATLISKTDSISCTTEKKGKYSEYFSKVDIDKIKSYELDFMLRFGFGIIRGNILNSAKHGVWSFHHGDEQKYRGGPYCFWEIFNNEPYTCAILQRLTDTLDGGIVLKKGYFKTISHSFKKNIDQSLSFSSDWPKQLCLEMENEAFQFPNVPVKTDSKIHFLPTNSQMILFVLKMLKNRIRNFYITYMTYDAWHVGYINKNINDVLKAPINNKEVNWMKHVSPHFFLADPFLAQINGETRIALEYLPYKGFKGEIKVFSGNQFELEKKEETIVENYHLSYPNIFCFDGKTYCLPEAYQAGGLFIYEKINEIWKKQLLIDNIKCIDPDIIFHEGYYYLFTTIKGQAHDTKLFIYYSKELLKGWQPHLLNPVVTDVRSARGAGKIFSDGNNLYRPGQNYSVYKEGSITISKINKLSPTQYAEEIALFVDPINDAKYSDKIHTINGYNDITVIDACKIRSLILRPDILFNIVKSKIG